MKKVLLSLFVCAFMVIPFMGVKAEEPTPVSDYAGLKANPTITDEINKKVRDYYNMK